MASINGVSIKNYKVQKVDFSVIPYAETDSIASGDVYYMGKPMFHFAEDVNGGVMNYSSIGNSRINNTEGINPAYYRWLSAITDKQYVSFENFLYNIMTVTDLEQFFKKGSKKGEITLFASFVLNGFGASKGYSVQGSKNLTEKIKNEIETKLLKEYESVSLNSNVNLYTKAYRRLEDFDIVIGTEKDAKLLYQKEIDEKREKVRKEKEEQEKSKKQADLFSKRFKKIEIQNEPAVYIEDLRTGKKAKVPLFALSEVMRVLSELYL